MYSTILLACAARAFYGKLDRPCVANQIASSPNSQSLGYAIIPSSVSLAL